MVEGLSSASHGCARGRRRWGGNEVFLFSRPQAIRSAQKSEGWTLRTVADELAPMLRPSFQPLKRSPEVFSWDPV
jgi:hypothetical protein